MCSYEVVSCECWNLRSQNLRRNSYSRRHILSPRTSKQLISSLCFEFVAKKENINYLIKVVYDCDLGQTRRLALKVVTTFWATPGFLSSISKIHKDTSKSVRSPLKICLEFKTGPVYIEFGGDGEAEVLPWCLKECNSHVSSSNIESPSPAI